MNLRDCLVQIHEKKSGKQLLLTSTTTAKAPFDRSDSDLVRLGPGEALLGRAAAMAGFSPASATFNVDYAARLMCFTAQCMYPPGK